MREEKRSQGQAYVFVVLALLVVLAAGALVVDVGRLLLVRNQAQNAADSAALAGAAQLPNSPSQAVSRAQSYLVSNNFQTSEATITTPYNSQANQVEVVINRNAGLFFARLFGQGFSNVTARAVAQSSGSVSSPDALNYAVVSGGNLKIAGSGNTFSGDVHANNQGKVTGSSNTGDGTFSAYSTISVTGSGNSFVALLPNQPKITFPTFDINGITYEQIYDGDHSFSSSDDGKLIRVNGDASFSGSGLTFTNLVVIATGKIHVSGSGITFTNDYTTHPETGCITFYSEDEIHLSGSSLNVQGLLWSKERFKLSGSGMNILGGVWGGTDLSYTEFTGSGNTITRDVNLPGGWPGTAQPTGVQLIE